MSGVGGAAIPIVLATVSGIGSTDATMVDWFARNTPVRVLTTKSIQLQPNPGNREPILAEPQPGCFVNAVGLRNPGVEGAVAEMQRIAAVRAHWPADRLLNVSIAGNSAAEFVALARQLGQWADLLELNVSCPHAHHGYGAAIGADAELVGEVTRAVVAALRAAEYAVPVYVKLTPNVADIGAIAYAACEAGASGLVAINTAGPVPYREALSGATVLGNPPDGLGGQSGEWVRAAALAAVRRIRETIGPSVPIIGMGGISSRADALGMRQAGADVIGVGSVLARLHQRDWPSFLASIASGEPVGTSPNSTETPVQPRHSARMSYRRMRVVERRDLDERLFELTADGELDYAPGQVCFVWLPGVGEKPFSPAGSAPFRLLIARRGPLTEALGRLQSGAELFVRGPYGDAVDCAAPHLPARKPHVVPPNGRQPIPAPPYAALPDAETADLETADLEIADVETAGASLPPVAAVVVAGSGAATAPALVQRLLAEGWAVELWIALRDDRTGVPLTGFLDNLPSERAQVRVVRDRGCTARALVELEAMLRGCGTQATRPKRIYSIGPEPFLVQTARLAEQVGIAPQEVYLSLERTMLCGVGLCGTCHNDGRLTCRFGTFVTAREYRP